MGIINRAKKDVIGITGSFSQVDVFGVYLDVASAIGMGDTEVYCDDHNHGDSSGSVISVCGIDSYGDYFESPLFYIGENKPHTVSELKELIGDSGKVIGVKCRVKEQCGIVERQYSVQSNKDGDVPICSVVFSAELCYDRKNWAVAITAKSNRPNYYKTQLGQIEVDLKEKLKIYGANIKLL